MIPPTLWELIKEWLLDVTSNPWFWVLLAYILIMGFIGHHSWMVNKTLN